MGAFFNGWRRKVGCVTLVMALATCANWVRSQIVMDILAHYTQTTWVRITSFDSMLWVEDRELVEGPTGSHWPGVSFRWATGLVGATEYSPYRDGSSPTFKDLPWLNRSQFAGFDVGEFQDIRPGVTYRCRVWGVPYCSIVAPLTLLSAYLLLSKRRTGIAASRPLAPREEGSDGVNQLVDAASPPIEFPVAEREVYLPRRVLCNDVDLAAFRELAEKAGLTPKTRGQGAYAAPLRMANGKASPL